MKLPKKLSGKEWLFIIVGLLAFSLLIWKSDFLGTVLVTCEIDEPETLAEFNTTALYYNGTLSYWGIDEFHAGNVSFNLSTYYFSTSLGDILIHDLASESCDDLLTIFYEAHNDSEQIIIGGKRVLVFNETIIWCNQADTFALSTENVNALSNYDQAVTTCIVGTFPADVYVTNPQECKDGYGRMVDGYCYCYNDSILRKDGECPFPDFVMNAYECEALFGIMVDGYCECIDGTRVVTGDTCTPPYINDGTDCLEAGGTIINGICECSDGTKLLVGETCPEEEPDTTSPGTTPATTPPSTTTPPVSEGDNTTLYLVLIGAVAIIIGSQLKKDKKKKK